MAEEIRFVVYDPTCDMGVMQPTKTTYHNSEYQRHWHTNAEFFDGQGCYDWMAEQLDLLQPARILDIGCGSGQGLNALLRRFNPSIVCLEENPDCIEKASKEIGLAGYDVSACKRYWYFPHENGDHTIGIDETPLSSEGKVSFIQADVLMADPELPAYLSQLPPFDAVTVWLIGTLRMRDTCRNISSLKIASPWEYRLHVQNTIYRLAGGLLRKGGWLQVIDRGEPPDEPSLVKDTMDSHRAQASGTSLKVERLSFRHYTEPTANGMGMVRTLPTSGRMPNLDQLAMVSVISVKE